MATWWPPRSSSRASSTTCFCAPCRPRSLITNNTRMLGALRRALVRLHPAAAPHLEGEQVPELLGVEAVVARAALAEIAHRARHHARIEDARLANAILGEVFAHERGELAAQPACERHAESLLGPLEQLTRHVLVEDLAQQVLGPQRPA